MEVQLHYNLKIIREIVEGKDTIKKEILSFYRGYTKDEQRRPSVNLVW